MVFYDMKKMFLSFVMATNIVLGVFADVPVPTGLAAGHSGSNADIPLTWNTVPEVDAYEVWRGMTDDRASAVCIASTEFTSFSDSNTTAGVTYRYWVRAAAGAQKSEFSEMVTGFRYPRPTQELHAWSDVSGVAISWTASPDATSYTVWRKDATNEENSCTVGVTESTSITDTNAVVGVEYLYWVGASVATPETGGGLVSSSDAVLGVFTGVPLPSVTDVVAKQRYPWNGLVDITCKVTGSEGITKGLMIALAAVIPDTGNARNVSHFWVVKGGTNSTDREVHANGNYRLLWDARADLGVVRYTNMVVRVQLKVQLWEDGPYWAMTNIGAENPEDFGYYFWWGDTVGYERVGNVWMAADRSSENFSFDDSAPTLGKSDTNLQDEGWVVSKDGTYVLAPEHDAAQVQWGRGWRMPTSAELSALTNNCDWTWTTMNGVTGYVVRGRGDYVANRIFLPCPGVVNGTSLNAANGIGDYWSSVPLSGSNQGAWSLRLNSNEHITTQSNRYWGRSVRPVQGFTR